MQWPRATSSIHIRLFRGTHTHTRTAEEYYYIIVWKRAGASKALHCNLLCIAVAVYTHTHTHTQRRSGGNERVWIVEWIVDSAAVVVVVSVESAISERRMYGNGRNIGKNMVRRMCNVWHQYHRYRVRGDETSAYTCAKREGLAKLPDYDAIVCNLCSVLCNALHGMWNVVRIRIARHKHFCLHIEKIRKQQQRPAAPCHVHFTWRALMQYAYVWRRRWVCVCVWAEWWMECIACFNQIEVMKINQAHQRRSQNRLILGYFFPLFFYWVFFFSFATLCKCA